MRLENSANLPLTIALNCTTNRFEILTMGTPILIDYATKEEAIKKAYQMNKNLFFSLQN